MNTEFKSLRAKTGMSRRAFYEEFGVPERTLQSWEEGDRTPPAYVVKMLQKQVDDYCNKNTKEVDKYFNSLMQYCFIMDRDEYRDYVAGEAHEYAAYGEITLDQIRKSIFDVYREISPETVPHLYTKEQAWNKVSDYANQDFYSLEQFSEDIYKACLAMQNEKDAGLKQSRV